MNHGRNVRYAANAIRKRTICVKFKQEQYPDIVADAEHFRQYIPVVLLPVPRKKVLEIQPACDMLKGNPLQKWSVFDFDL